MNDYNYDYESLYYTTSDPSTTTDPAVAIAAMAGFFVLWLIFSAALYVIGALLLGRVFKKAGQPQWPAWVPIYNSWKLLEIGGQQGFWAVLALIPIVNIVSLVFMYIAMYHIGKNLGKSDAFVLLAIFLPIVWLIILAVDKSTWKGSKVTPASAEPTAPTAS